MSPQGLIVGHCWLIVLIMSPNGLIINNELFTMRSHFIMRLIVPQVYLVCHLREEGYPLRVRVWQVRRQ